MLTLLSETRFWTVKDDINIKDTDLGAYKYVKRSDQTNEGKQLYAEKRGIKWTPTNKRPVRLRSCLKQLEDELKHRRVVFCEWKDSTVLQLMVCNGLLVHICVNPSTGDILRIAFDKYFIGKLVSESITDVIITRMHIIISYNENQVTFVYLQKPNMKRSSPEKISRMDPKIFNIIIGGPQGRKIPRHLSCNGSFDLLAVWTKSSQNEVYPWRPTVRDSDRANIHVYKISRTKLELMCYHWTENDPICVEFSKLDQNQFQSVEQKISKKGDVTIENCKYEINQSKIQRVAVTSIPLQTQVCCHSFSPDNEKLMLGCIDGSVLLFDEGRGITHLVKAAFIPTQISWHSDSALVMIANERSQFQCFDISLSCVKNQLISEDMTPSNLLDLSGYFTSQPTLLKSCWNKKPDLALHTDPFTQNDCFLLLLFENGPLACMRFFGGAGLKGDIHTSGFTADVLVNKYLNLNQIEKAINILLCLNWDTYGAMCLIALHKIANYCFKHVLTSDREVQLQKALGSFHVPVKPLCYETEVEFGDQVRDITRKFFYWLLRYKSYDKAFSLAIDINDEDLFMDLHNAAKSDNEIELAVESFKKAEEILARPTSAGSDHSTCSNSSCSICSASSGNESEKIEQNPDVILNHNKDVTASSSVSSSSSARKINSLDLLNHPPLPKFNQSKPPYVPPLPYFTNTVNMPNEIRINIPKPELKVSRESHVRTKSKATTSETNSRSNDATRYIPSSNIILTDPPLPNLIKKQPQYSSQQIFPELPQHLSNSYSTNFIDQYQPPSESYRSIAASQANTRFLSNHPSDAVLSKAAKRAFIQPQQHVVLDVFPKPKSSAKNYEKVGWSEIPDQTIGIPLTFNHSNDQQPPTYWSSRIVPSALMKAESMYEINTNSKLPPIVHQYPLVSGNIPNSFSAATKYLNNAPIENQRKQQYSMGARIHSNRETIPSNSILSNGITTNVPMISGSSAIGIRKEAGEKNKVKFSDTITVATVPEIPRKEKPPKRNGFRMDPRRELADSLPLCHPQDEYLKLFTPMSDVNPEVEETEGDGRNVSSIKVVHFGVV